MTLKTPSSSPPSPSDADANAAAPFDRRSFEGRNVLVTGATGGIGIAVCRRFAAAGARVILQTRSRENEAAEIAAALPASGVEGADHFVLRADLGDPEQARDLVDQAVRRAGRLDVLVNNAGVFEEHPPLEFSWDDWREAWERTLAVNLSGPAHSSWAAARHMADGDGGRIINISSRGAFRGEPDSPAYGASKAGLNALGQSLAKALAPAGVFVFTIAPGFVETPMVVEHLRGAGGDAIRSQSPLQRVATADEVAFWVMSCAAPEASFATGAVIDVNGASYLRT